VRLVCTSRSRTIRGTDLLDGAERVPALAGRAPDLDGEAILFVPAVRDPIDVASASPGAPDGRVATVVAPRLRV